MQTTNRRFQLSGLFILAVLGFSLIGQAATDFEKKCKTLAAQKGSDGKRLQKLFDLTWDYQNIEYPESATFEGYPGQNDRWTDESPAAVERRKQETLAPLQVIKSINRAKLSPADQLNYDLFKHDAEWNVEGLAFPDEYLAINQNDGPQQNIASTLAQMPHGTRKDFDDAIARLKAAPVLIAQTTAWLQAGLQKKITVPKILLRHIPEQIKEMVSQPLEKSAFMAPFEHFPDFIDQATQEKYRSEARSLISKNLNPALQEFARFVKEVYTPSARETIGYEALPNGKAWYAYKVKTSTTLNLLPAEIHQIGLNEVLRIRKEMEAVRDQVKFKGSLPEFQKYLHSDSRFFHTSVDELILGYRDIAKRVDPELIHQFGRLPRMPYGVKAMPAYAEKAMSAAYYESGSFDAQRAGFFNANTYDLKSRTKWEMEALVLHESVPGHHLQISIAQEMVGAPQFRKHGGYTAFVEGWGLYAESLGKALGLYKDPYSYFGRLNMEIWRAARLVVDTGMHSLGWSRQKAIDYFEEITGKSEHDSTVEIDRYISWPGQALAYKMGQLKFQELKDKYSKALGEKFDVRSFHDAALENGALPLDLLETRMNLWLQKSMAKK